MKDLSLTEILAATTALAFLLTVSYGYGFSTVLGFNVFNYFTVNDYFRQSVGWLTASVITTGIGFFLGWFPKRDSPSNVSTRPPITSDWWRFAAAVAVLLLVLWTAAYYQRLPRQVLFLAVGMLILVLWASLAGLYVQRLEVEGKWTVTTRNCLVYLPASLILVFFTGAYNAETDFRYFPASVSTRIALKDKPRLLTGTIILNLDQFLLLRDDDNEQIKIIPQSEIGMIIHDN